MKMCPVCIWVDIWCTPPCLSTSMYPASLPRCTLLLYLGTLMTTSRVMLLLFADAKCCESKQNRTFSCSDRIVCVRSRLHVSLHPCALWHSCVISHNISLAIQTGKTRRRRHERYWFSELSQSLTSWLMSSPPVVFPRFLPWPHWYSTIFVNKPSNAQISTKTTHRSTPYASRPCVSLTMKYPSQTFAHATQSDQGQSHHCPILGRGASSKSLHRAIVRALPPYLPRER